MLNTKKTTVTIENKSYPVEVWKDEKTGFHARAALDLRTDLAPPGKPAVATSKAPVAAVYNGAGKTEQAALDAIKQQIWKDLDRIAREKSRTAH